jgi:sugar lactone lactonase YvrE
MKKTFVSTLLLFASCLIANPTVAQEWQPLFDGASLDGWNQKGGKAKYEVVDGVIVGSSVPNTPNSFLCTDKDYGDFEMELEFHVDHRLNSGIQIRSQSLDDYKNGRVHGYQVEIDPSDRGYTAGIYDEARRGWLNPLSEDVSARYAFKQNQWNHVRVVAVGNRIRTWLNGYPAADLIDSETPTGFIALQVHGVGKRTDPMTVKWKNIRLRENPENTVEEDIIRKLIPAATAMKRSDFMELATSGAAPNAETVAEKTLTLMMLASVGFGNKDMTQSAVEELSMTSTGMVDPAKLAQEIVSGRVTTMIKQNRIQDIHCVVAGDSAVGWFSFEVPNLYQGKAHYSATRTDSSWKITELSMPARGVFLKLNDDGKWSVDDSRTNDVFAAQPEISKLAEGFKFTEGPALGPDGKIYFNDIPNKNTIVYDPATKQNEVFRANSNRANGMFWSPAGALISCEAGSRSITRNFDGKVTKLTGEFESKKLNSPNDLCLDTAGGIFFTDPRYGNQDDMEMEVQGVYYLARGTNKPVRVIDDLVKPNGILFSADFKTLYVADLGANKTWAYDVDSPGKLSNKRLFFNLGSDGMTVDTQGSIYLTTQGAIHVISPLAEPMEVEDEEVYGSKIAELKMPEAPANCLLVGNTLYVTARKGFYSVETNRTGIRQAPAK